MMSGFSHSVVVSILFVLSTGGCSFSLGNRGNRKKQVSVISESGDYV